MLNPLPQPVKFQRDLLEAASSLTYHNLRGSAGSFLERDIKKGMPRTRKAVLKTDLLREKFERNG